jgi:hypothetical protein
MNYNNEHLFQFITVIVYVEKVTLHNCFYAC